jgi:hypothetical protein
MARLGCMQASAEVLMRLMGGVSSGGKAPLAMMLGHHYQYVCDYTSKDMFCIMLL